MVAPTEPFCKDCPDHEACSTGYSCWMVKAVDQLFKEITVADNLDVNPRDVDPHNFPLKARHLVAAYANDHFEKTDGTKIDASNTYVVWFAFVLGGWKALVSTTLPDGKYYEVTYDKVRGATYIDVYVKVDNKEIRD